MHYLIVVDEMLFADPGQPHGTTNLHQLIGRAMQLHQSRRFPEAEAIYVKVLQLQPGNHQALHLMGMLRLQQNNIPDAIALMERALHVQPASPETLANYGMALKAAGRFQEALATLDREAKLRPTNSRSLNNRGTVLVKLKRMNEAIEAFEAAALLDRDNTEILTNLAFALQAVRRLEEAIQLFSRVVTLRPRDIEAWNNRGNCWREMNAPAAALADFDQAHTLATGNPGILLNRANTLVAMDRLDEGLTWFNALLGSHPALAAARMGRANIFERKNKLELAIADLEAVKQVNPDYPYVAGRLLHLKARIADWSDFTRHKTEIDVGVRAGKPVIEPFVYNGLSDSLPDLQACARRFTADRYPAGPGPASRPARRPGRIRVGYVAGEFHNHATTLLSIGLFENHDRRKFDISAFDNGGSDSSPMRARFESAVPNVVSIAGLSDQEVVRQIAKAEIDILVNLNGHVGLHRTGVFAQKPAPIQVSYLGFPGTMGAPYMDYLLADAELIFEDEQQYFDEKVAWLPDSYQINDDRRFTPDVSERKAHGLEEGTFVFAQFNASYKVTPDLFAVWTRLLARLENSVLWLFQDNEQCADNLLESAARSGIDPQRLIFAPKLSHEDHLARLPLADLLLDTFPCSAHTVASEALWMGVPLLTCRGNSFASRVAASLCAAAGVPELIAHGLAEYERKAQALAHDPELLQELRSRLVSTRLSCPLFRTGNTVRHIEAAFTTMFERQQAGLLPESFRVNPLKQ